MSESEIQQLINEVAEILETVDAETLDQWEREEYAKLTDAAQ
jgi:hypothetical protein